MSDNALFQIKIFSSLFVYTLCFFSFPIFLGFLLRSMLEYITSRASSLHPRFFCVFFWESESCWSEESPCVCEVEWRGVKAREEGERRS